MSDDKVIHPPVDEYWGVDETDGYKIRTLEEAAPTFRTPLHGARQGVHVDEPEPEGPEPEDEDQ